MSYPAIEDHGVIGDLHTVALVCTNGSIDFMCFPHFNSPTIFGALLDSKNGGFFQLAPTHVEAFRLKQVYLPDTNILLTRFLGADGVAEVSDFMPAQHLGHQHDLVRRIKVVRGSMSLRMVCAPRFDYGRAGHTVQKRKGELIFRSRGADKVTLRLRASIPVRIQNGAAVADFRLRAGEIASFVLEDASTASEDCASVSPEYVVEAFKETMNFWTNWVGRSKYQGRWREVVNRSALTLKLLTSQQHGSMVAAPTFGLPEVIGGVRNWDYRYTWIRDASFAVDALMRLGYLDEVGDFVRWMGDRCQELEAERPLQIMYGIDGARDLQESTLTHLSGYRRSRPVRIGNAAFEQHQLDIYGELLDLVYIYNKFGDRISYDFWLHLVKVVNWVCDHWQESDSGIWEMRTQLRPFLNSRVLCWVALDRGIRIAYDRSFPAPLDRWYQTRDKIYREVYEHFWSPELGSFVQYKGSRSLDASCLLMPVLKFIGPTDPRWLSTLQAIQKRLVQDSLVYRYDEAKDGLPGQEGSFSICSFWYVRALARAGDLKQARFVFEKVLGYANHLGLYSEQLGLCGEHLGNFPQAFTHIGLISAAWNLDNTLSRSGQSEFGDPDFQLSTEPLSHPDRFQ